MLYKFYIWGKFDDGSDDSGEAFVVANDLYHAYYKLIECLKHNCVGFRLMKLNLMDISTSKGVIIDWFKQDKAS